jgi:hypothetical protein
MRYMGKRVKMNGYEGEVVSYDTGKQTYSVKFDKGHPFMMDTWDGFSESSVKVALLAEEQRRWSWSPPKIKKCECGAGKLEFRNISPYSHAQWCDMFRQGEIDE